MSEKYIFLNNKKKILNPLFDPDKCNLVSYHGPLDNIDFEYQSKNYQAITESLKPFNIFFNEIWYGKFGSNKGRTQFLVKSSNGKVFWQKYEGKSMGSGQNRIFINGNFIKTTLWLKLSQDERENLLNSVDDSPPSGNLIL